MYVTVTRLQYWKSEHGEHGCEDAAAFDLGRGLFAVADGVSTTSFSAAWAQHLVKQFVEVVPLLSDDPFELDWWAGEARAGYVSPDLSAVPEGLLREKADEGSASTLATLRVTRVTDADAEAEVVTVGDSCILLRRAHGRAEPSFPLADGAAFDAHPVCLHSRRFQRAGGLAKRQTIQVHTEDIVILATDAVARWVIEGCRARRRSPGDAIQWIATLTPERWSTFVEECRQAGEMADDDSTALLLRFSDTQTDSADAQGDAGRGRLAANTGLPDTVRDERQQELDRALERRDSVRIARLAGDVAMWAPRVGNENIPAARDKADDVARARAAILAALNAATLNSPAAVRSVWEQHAELLTSEPDMAALRDTLRREGWISALADERTTP